MPINFYFDFSQKNQFLWNERERKTFNCNSIKKGFFFWKYSIIIIGHCLENIKIFSSIGTTIYIMEKNEKNPLVLSQNNSDIQSSNLVFFDFLQFVSRYFLSKI